MHKIRVGVIRGGPSHQYDSSLKTGANVLKSLSSEGYADKYNVRDILVDRAGVWHVHGIPTTPHEALTHLDVAFNALHGNYGEDGKIQHIFEVHGIPFTGSGSFSSAMGMNKSFSKEVYRKEKIKTPDSRLIESLADISKQAHQILRAFPLPMVVKPVSGGASHGLTIVKDFSKFEEAVANALEYSNAALVEEYIKGKEASCGVIDDFRDKEHYALPVVEIGQNSEHIVPSNLTSQEKKDIEEMAIRAHKVLGLDSYSQSDFIIHPKRGIFIIETNTLPVLHEESIMTKALHAVGAPISHFLDHILELALRRK